MLTALAFTVIAACVPPPSPDTPEERLKIYATGACIETKWSMWDHLPTIWFEDLPFELKSRYAVERYEATQPRKAKPIRSNGRIPSRFHYRILTDWAG